MGNRVNIKLKDGKKQSACALYLHWNGGIESTHAFFNGTYDFMKAMNRNGDLSYFTARFIQAIGNYLGGACSVGIIPLADWKDGSWNDHPSIVYDINNEHVTAEAEILLDGKSDRWARDVGPEHVEQYRAMRAQVFNSLAAHCSAYEMSGNNELLRAATAHTDRLLQQESEAIKMMREKEKRQARLASL